MKLGTDYYLEDGNFVFTADYHRQRGYCCGSGCRHCPFVFDQEKVRVASLVPSWSETLIECGIEVVGRSRFCIHPNDKVRDIPVVGGTKDLKPELIKQLEPDFVILDKEENTREMADQLASYGIHLLVSHVTDLESFGSSLIGLNRSLLSSKINHLIQRVKKQESQPIDDVLISRNFPGVLEWVFEPKDFSKIRQLVYIIWKNPWLRVSPDTYIGSQIKRLGYKRYLEHDKACASKRYPGFEWDDYDKETTLFLFSSEPYPFHQRANEIRALGVYAAVVDGEKFSWFGLRGFNFLEEHFRSAETGRRHSPRHMVLKNG